MVPLDPSTGTSVPAVRRCGELSAVRSRHVAPSDAREKWDCYRHFGQRPNARLSFLRPDLSKFGSFRLVSRPSQPHRMLASSRKAYEMASVDTTRHGAYIFEDCLLMLLPPSDAGWRSEPDVCAVPQRLRSG